MTKTYKAVFKDLTHILYSQLEKNRGNSDMLKIQDFVSYDVVFMNSVNGLSSSVFLSFDLVFAGAMASQFF